MIRDELSRLTSWGEHHRRFAARLVLLLGLTLVVDAIGAVLIWLFERGEEQGDIHHLWDAFFFTTTQLLTVSSQISNPYTVGGRVVDIVLEAWGVLFVAAIAGAFAVLFLRSD